MSQQKQTTMTLPSSSKSGSLNSGQVWSSTTATRSKETTFATSKENLSESKIKSMTTTSTERITREDSTTIHRLQSLRPIRQPQNVRRLWIRRVPNIQPFFRHKKIFALVKLYRPNNDRRYDHNMSAAIAFNKLD